MHVRRAVMFAALAVLPACGSTTTEPTYSVDLTPATITLTLGGPSATVTLTATVTQKLGSNSVVDNTSAITWTTSDANVATVVSSGRTATITATGQGTATIAATAHDVRSSITVTVLAGPLTGTVATSPTVQFGGAQGFCTYTVTFTNISMTLVPINGGTSVVTGTMNEAVVPPSCATPAAPNLHTYTASAVLVNGTTIAAPYIASGTNKPQGTLNFAGTLSGDKNSASGTLTFNRTDAAEEILRWTVTVPITILRH